MSQKSARSIENVHGVEEAFGFRGRFPRRSASADGFDAVAFEQALEGDFLAGEEFFVDLQKRRRCG